MSTKDPLKGKKGYITSHLETDSIWVKSLKFEKEDNGNWWYRIIYDRDKFVNKDDSLYEIGHAERIQDMLEAHFEGLEFEVLPESMDWMFPSQKYRIKAQLRISKRPDPE